jgi:hypothetical protein
MEQRSPLAVDRGDDEPDVAEESESGDDTVLDEGVDAPAAPHHAEADSTPASDAASGADADAAKDDEAARDRRSHRRRGRRGGRRSRPGGDAK